jgi:hypothetical protein
MMSDLKESASAIRHHLKTKSSYRDIKLILTVLEENAVQGKITKQRFQAVVEYIASKKRYPNILPVLETLKAFSLECHRGSRVGQLSSDHNHGNDASRFRDYQTLFKLHSSIHDFDIVNTEHSMSLHRADNNLTSDKLFHPKEYKKSQHIVFLGLTLQASSLSSAYEPNNNLSFDSDRPDGWIVNDPITPETFCWNILDRVGIVDKALGIFRGNDVFDYNVNDLAYEVIVLNTNKSAYLSRVSRMLISAGCDVVTVNHENMMVEVLLKKSIDFVIMDADALIFTSSEPMRLLGENEIPLLTKRHHISAKESDPQPQLNLSSLSTKKRVKDMHGQTHDILTSRIDPPTFIPKLLMPIKQSMKIQRYVANESGSRCFIPASVRRLSDNLVKFQTTTAKDKHSTS